MRKLLSLTTCLVLALGAVACGEGDTDDPTTPGAQDPIDDAANKVDIAMVDYGFTISGEAHPGPLQVNFTNTGQEIHHGIIGKLDEGKTIEDVKKAAAEDGPPPPWFDDTPFDLQVLSPGNTAGIWIDAEPGNYALLCFMPDKKGTPHVAHGMYSLLEVAEGEAMDMGSPEVDASISMSEEGAEVPDLEAGESVLSVTNDGKIPGEFLIARVAEGKKLADIEKWFGSGQKGPAPVSFFGGTHAYEPGETVTMSANLEAGDYTFLITYDEGKKKKDIEVEFTVG